MTIEEDYILFTSLVAIVSIITVIVLRALEQYKSNKKTNTEDLMHPNLNFINYFPENKEDMDLENADEFIILISKRYNSYETFLRSRDFDDYFTWWNNHPEALDKLKILIAKKI